MAAAVLALGPLERLGTSLWFLAIALGCFALLLLSVLLGQGHDHDADHDADHDSPGGGRMSPFSIKIILAFGVGFGAGGYIASRYDWGWLGSSLGGLLGGLVVGTLCYIFLNALYTHQGSSTVHLDRLVGAQGIVDATIDPGSLGRIVVSLPSGQETFLARSATGVTLALHTSVTIVGVDGSIVSVEPSSPS